MDARGPGAPESTWCWPARCNDMVRFMQLILNPGALDEQVFELAEGPITIGRTEECNVCVLHKSLSRRHARLEREGE